MNVSSKAIVLHTTRVSDRTSILHLYTRECGRIPYYVYGTSSRKSAKQAMLMPLAMLDIEAVHMENRDVQQLRDWQLAYVASSTMADIYRRTEALFIAEILYRTLTHPLADPLLFDFLADTLEALETRPDPENVHLEFLFGFIEYLGFAIDMDNPANLPFLPIVDHTPITHSRRQDLLRLLMKYYEEHLPDFRTPKSLDVMIQVFND